MSRIIFRLLVVGMLTFIPVSLAARVLGAIQPISPVLEGFITHCDDKPNPCWYGVVPGVTTETEALELLAFAGEHSTASLLSGEGYSLIYRFSPPAAYCRVVFFVRDALVYRVELSLCRTSTIFVGDLVTLLDGEDIIMSMPPNELVYDGVSMNIDEWPSPKQQVVYITLLAANSDYPRYPWYGFLTRWRYCQLVDYFPRCRVVRR